MASSRKTDEEYPKAKAIVNAPTELAHKVIIEKMVKNLFLFRLEL